MWAAYRDPRVARWAGWTGNAGAEEPAGPGLAPLPFLPGMPPVTLLSLWTERLVCGSPAPVAGTVPVLTPRALSWGGGAAGGLWGRAWRPPAAQERPAKPLRRRPALRGVPRGGAPGSAQRGEGVPPTFISAPSWKRSSGNCPAGESAWGLSGGASGPVCRSRPPTPSCFSLTVVSVWTLPHGRLLPRHFRVLLTAPGRARWAASGHHSSVDVRRLTWM